TTAATTHRPTTAATTSRPTTTATTSRPTTAATTSRPATTTTTSRPTAAPTATRKPTATATPTSSASGGSFPVKSYGTFFRDQYGQNSQITTAASGGLHIDAGSSSYGVVLVRIDTTGIPASKRCKIIVIANKASYQYNISERGKYIGIPLQLGNGNYTLSVYEQVEGTSYEPRMVHAFSVSLSSSLRPFTAASIISDFSRSSSLVSRAGQLSSGQSSQTDRVTAVYSWIVKNISYDHALASQFLSSQSQHNDYLPDPNRTFSSGKGICYDYASLMCAMLRSQGIPTRLIKGSTPLGYHAWNEVFFEGKGWVVVAGFRWQESTGSVWVMLDSTWAASGMSPEKIVSTSHNKQRIY
ncbi:MAG: transglutaminase domain-containing protein, partial [Ruminococcaceae bacterium]|nr:transglutaminase domain-containing protein [Oscillospiraceae bacterium]